MMRSSSTERAIFSARRCATLCEPHTVTYLQHLWVPAEDLATPQDLRCAMLIALATTDVARERARALAAQVVDPDVQALFQAIADGASDDQLAPLLGRVSNTASA